MKNKYRFDVRFIIEVSIYKIIDINESIKNKEFEDISEEIPKGKRLLIRNLNNFISFEILRISSLALK